MARPHKGMIGSSYHIVYRSDSAATVDCTYLCPYCNNRTTSSFDADDSTTLDHVEKGGFFEPLRCDICGKVSDVRFYAGMKI